MKKILLSLVLGFVGLLSFSNAGNIDYNTSYSVAGNSTVSTSTGDCFYIASNFYWFRYVEYGNQIQGDANHVYCFTSEGSIKNNLGSNLTFSKFNISSLFPTCEVCEECDLPYTSEECQQEYGLMSIDSCNSEYCELNGLCEVIGGSGSSTLYINDVWHESAPFIYVNIPEEFKRDYLTGEQEFTINVEGLNGDQDYINGIIDVNSYRPTSEDFTQTFVGGLTLIFPYIIITAVILFIWRFIRKIFK